MMYIKYTMHGKPGSALTMLEGLVRRNQRALRADPKLRPSTLEALRSDPSGTWQDVLSAVRSGKASVGTRAAWMAAHLREQGDAEARVAFYQDLPVVATTAEGAGSVAGVPHFRVAYRAPGGHSEPPQVGGTGTMRLTIDDDKARAVREVGDAIARHNAKRIREIGLPKLYASGIRYETEGTPEQWLDAEEMLKRGVDDCEGLAAYRVGELLNAGYDARVHTRAIAIPEQFAGGRKGSRLFHALVVVHGLRDDGKVVYDDPSVRLGMPVPDWYREVARKKRLLGGDLG